MDLKLQGYNLMFNVADFIAAQVGSGKTRIPSIHSPSGNNEVPARQGSTTVQICQPGTVAYSLKLNLIPKVLNQPSTSRQGEYFLHQIMRRKIHNLTMFLRR